MDPLEFSSLPIMGIVRGLDDCALEPLLEAVISGGLKTLEITMNTQNAAQLIRKAVRIAKGRLTIGAGTVLTMTVLREALAAGATFIVSPVLVEDVVDSCVWNKIPIFPGALTPQEIYRAWNAGATMVKVFPAKLFGPAYFKEIKAPLNEVKLLACSGVTPDNLVEYFSQGAQAVAFGSGVFRRDWIINREFEKIQEQVGRFLQAFKQIENN